MFLIGSLFNGSLFGSANTQNMANPVLAGLSLRLWCRSQVGGVNISISGTALGLFCINILVIMCKNFNDKLFPHAKFLLMRLNFGRQLKMYLEYKS